MKTCAVNYVFYIRAFRGACEYTWKHWSILGNSSAQLEIKDMVNECLELLVEVYMKVMNGLVMKEDKRFLSVWLLYYVSNFANSWMNMPRYRSSPTSWDHVFSQCIQQQWSVSQNTSIWSKLPTAAYLPRRKKERKLWSQLAVHVCQKWLRYHRHHRQIIHSVLRRLRR